MEDRFAYELSIHTDSYEVPETISARLHSMPSAQSSNFRERVGPS